MKYAVAGVIFLSVVLGLIFWKTSSNDSSSKNQENGPIVLNYWGLFEDEETLKPVVEVFEQTHPNISINYVKQSPLNYRTRIQTQIREGQGPDVFRIHNSWIGMFFPDLYPAPDSILSASEFTNTFYTVATDTLTVQGRVYAIPLEIDGLALYYNEDILKAANVSPPKNWLEFIDGAKKMTVKNEQGQIQTSGAALGTTTNVDYWPEIISTLFFQQPNVSLQAPAMPEGGEVLSFYTSFITDPKRKTWDTTLPSSSNMFASGNLAYYFGPSTQAQVFRTTNPSLNFKIAPVPQLGTQAVWGGFWAEGVSSGSTHPKEAWEFVKFLSSPQALQLIYQQKSQSSLLGKPFPRKDMAELLSTDPILSVYVKQAPIYKSWYLNSGVSDAGINEEVVRIYQQAIDATLQGQDPVGLLDGVQRNTPLIIDKYTKPQVTPTVKR